MSLEQPSITAGYLHQILVNGATPFRYRSHLRSLLGMSGYDVNLPAAATNLPPIELFYATGRSPSMMAHPALIGWEDQNVANTTSVDRENSPTIDPLESAPSPLVEPNLQTNLPTLLASSAQRLSLQKPELTQEEPINSGIDKTFPSAIEAIAPATTAELPTRENCSDTALENPPVAVIIPGVSDHPLPSIDHRQTIPKSPQSNELGNAVDSGVESNDQMNNGLMGITAMPSHINDRDAEVSNVLRSAPTRINPQSLPSSSLSNLAITSAQYPQSIPLEANIDDPVVSPSPVSFRPNARTDANTNSDERLTVQDTSVPTPIPMSQGSQLMGITAMPSHINDRDAEVSNVLRSAPTRINPQSLPSSSLSNLAITSAQYPQSIPLEANIDDPVVSPSPVSFRPNARTDANTSSDERLTVQDTPVPTPTPTSQGNPHAPLPIAALAMPMASASTLPNRSAIASQPASRVTEEITKLRSIVAELTAQVVAQQEFQLPAAPIVLPPSVPIIERSVSSTKPPKAFWERSYMSRLYRLSRR